MMISSKTGIPPPLTPVLPPCGTTAKERWLQYFNMLETWSVEVGNKHSLLYQAVSHVKLM